MPDVTSTKVLVCYKVLVDGRKPDGIDFLKQVYRKYSPTSLRVMQSNFRSEEYLLEYTIEYTGLIEKVNCEIRDYEILLHRRQIHLVSLQKEIRYDSSQRSITCRNFQENVNLKRHPMGQIPVRNQKLDRGEYPEIKRKDVSIEEVFEEIDLYHNQKGLG